MCGVAVGTSRIAGLESWFSFQSKTVIGNSIVSLLFLIEQTFNGIFLTHLIN
jgi:hypothetical protein